MLNTNITDISFYCKRLAKKITKLNLKTVNDLFFYYPNRYEDYSNIKKISELHPNETVTIKAKIELIKNFRSSHKNKKITESLISDESGKMKVIWFNQWYLTQSIKPGDEFYFVIKPNNGYTHEVISPEYEKVSDNPTHLARISPIYPLTYGLSQKQLRTVIKNSFNFLDHLEDYIPYEILKNNNLVSLKDAIKNIHFPESNNDLRNAISRLSFDELFFTHLQNEWLKKDLENKNAKKQEIKVNDIKKLLDKLPFQLTNAQKKSSWEILKDMERSSPMNRLLNGDVGSGKTLVSVIAMYNCILNGHQSVLLAPTEILALQHYNTFCKLFSDMDIKIGLVSRGQKTTNYELKITNKKNAAQEIVKNSEILIGTHALIQENIQFNNLGLTVIDEQHRFGVEQRKKLASSNNDTYPHLLSMTATPIPRTFALLSYGDLNLSLLDELPKGRQDIKTFVVTEAKRQDTYNFIKKQIKEGRQAFVVCPLVDESDKLGVKSVTEEHKKLNEQIFINENIEIIHGKLKSKEKEEIMNNFKNKKIDILVSTSVVEVGVDIPNATIMMIEGAERFGLAQLHQFRGRVGRGEHQSYCLLFPTEKPTERLMAMETIKDGFQLAELDLKLRGPGKIYGKEQSGKVKFKLADINNMFLIKQARDGAGQIINTDPELKKYPYLRAYLEEKIKSVHLE